MNGANLPVFLLEVNGANLVFYRYFKQKRAILLKFSESKHRK